MLTVDNPVKCRRSRSSSQQKPGTTQSSLACKIRPKNTCNQTPQKNQALRLRYSLAVNDKSYVRGCLFQRYAVELPVREDLFAANA